MRIIACLYRGRVLKTLRGLQLRPTSGRLRETLFDVLGDAVQGEVFMDVYAGSGAVGLEALSRGAKQVFFLEENAAACRLLSENIAALGTAQSARLLRVAAHKGLRQLEREGVRVNCCFLDPPYAMQEEAIKVLSWLTRRQLMATDGLIILQHSRKESTELKIGDWSRVRLLVQGSNALSFYQAVSDQETMGNQPPGSFV
ncbi:MAG: 16S rRNA (guanine(966)-N(2))-methyltransferase RsmD [Acidobacteria bacterium]|nr:16S rRNA (guanine(966)-N(2))-methyltransferase RsmD [Acidobacteriota bacterium]